MNHVLNVFAREFHLVIVQGVSLHFGDQLVEILVGHDRAAGALHLKNQVT